MFDASFATDDAARLSQLAARLAARLAALLERNLEPARGALADAISFLRAMAAPVGDAVLADDLSAAETLPSSWLRLCDGLQLSPLERELVVLAGLPEEHEGFASVLRSLHPRSEPRASAGLAAQLLTPTPRERAELRHTLATGAAVQSGLLSLTSLDAPLFEQSLVLADALWPVFAGVDAWPAKLHPLAEPSLAVGLEEWLTSSPVRRALVALRAGSRALVLVTGPTETVALARALTLVGACGQPWRSFAPLPIASEARQDGLLTLHCLARGAIPVLRLAPAEGAASPFAPDLPRLPGPLVVFARAGSVALGPGRPVLRVEAQRLSSPALEAVWGALLPGANGITHVLAARYALEPALAATVAADVQLHGSELRGQELIDRVAESVRLRSQHGGTSGVRLISPRASWDDLVLPPEKKARLRDALDRLLYQGRVLDEWRLLARRPGARGVRILLAGPPGTGKTLSAEVLASSLGVDLLVVDISRVVSKWIGETEKNLAEVFDAAERTQAVLLFDEADALFSRRTEVSDAHDRYANLETAFLLTRLESFEGLVVLSTNLRQNIDAAFLRRLEFVIDLAEPAVPEREALWRAHLPSSAPLADDVSFSELSRLYTVPGGLIRNAAVAAAFQAAAAGSVITKQHLMRALRREYEKTGRAFPAAPNGLSGS